MKKIQKGFAYFGKYICSFILLYFSKADVNSQVDKSNEIILKPWCELTSDEQKEYIDNANLSSELLSVYNGNSYLIFQTEEFEDILWQITNCEENQASFCVNFVNQIATRKIQVYSDSSRNYLIEQTMPLGYTVYHFFKEYPNIMLVYLKIDDGDYSNFYGEALVYLYSMNNLKNLLKPFELEEFILNKLGKVSVEEKELLRFFFLDIDVELV